MPLRSDEALSCLLRDKDVPLERLEEHIDKLESLVGRSAAVQMAPLLKGTVDEGGFLDTHKVFPKTDRCGMFLHPRYAAVPVHRHDYHEIKYMLRGTIRMPTGTQDVTLEQGDLILIRPGVAHHPNITDPDTLLLNIVIHRETVRLVFPRIFQSQNRLSTFFSESGSAPFLQYRCGGDERLKQMLLDSLGWHQAGTPGEQLLCESTLEQVLLEVLYNHEEDYLDANEAVPIPDRLLPILDYIQTHSATARLEEVAERFHYSQPYLSRMIRRYTGSSYSELVQTARLSRAAQLLRTTDLPILEVMEQTGYTGRTNFYRQFSQHFGVTPAKLRPNSLPPDTTTG